MGPIKQVILGTNPVGDDAYMHCRSWKSSGVLGVHVVSASKGVCRHLTQYATSTPTISALIPPHDAEGPNQDTLVDTMIKMKNSFRRLRLACYIDAGTTNCSNGP